MPRAPVLQLLARPAALAVLLATLPACGSRAPSGPGDRDGGADAGDTTRRDGGPVALDAGGLPGASDASLPPGDPAVIKAGTVPIGGLDVEVELMGTATSTRPPVIFLHMGPGFAHEYLPPLMRFLLPGRLLVFYDMRGSGLSSVGTATVTLQQHARDLADLTDWTRAFTGGSPQLDLVAHGYGTAVAVLFAAAHPEQVAHLVLSDPYPADLNQLATLRAEALARLTTSERSLYYTVMATPKCRGDDNMCTLELWTLLGPHYLCPANAAQFDGLMFRYASDVLEARIELYMRQHGYDLRPSLAQISAPTTVISGPCDPTPAAAAATYTASISGSQAVTLDGAGFFPMVETATAFQAAVLRALGR